MSRDDDFRKPVISLVSQRAAYICSNPDCKTLTLSGAVADSSKTSNIGVVSHITAASVNGPRYDDTITSDQRKSDENAIFLCENCASLIDKNSGIDYAIETLRGWKKLHEKWVICTQNMKLRSTNTLSLLDVSAHLDGDEFPAIDIKILNNSDEVFYITKGKVQTVARYQIPADKDATFRPIDWTYNVEISISEGESVEFEMSQEITPRSSDRFSIKLKGNFPWEGAIALNLFEVVITLFQGENIVLTLPNIIIHVPRAGKILAISSYPYSKEQYLELLQSMGVNARDVLSRLEKSINEGAQICCDYEVAHALTMFACADKKIRHRYSCK